ncbi:hypothetical protein VTL71DRAFT_14288 [Oculimacula yallundae]|uniref:RING-type domain-containing protein n=1 Tax=Oculimacula yallundae TaxID=86028 RepID=A0ABR4CI24_9HELO
MEITKPSWWPERGVIETFCLDYKHLYTGCGCIHEGFRSLTVHSKECVYSRNDKMTEEQYQQQRYNRPCKSTDTIHVLFDGPCQLCQTGSQIFSRSHNGLRRVKSKLETALKVEDRSPPRQKLPATAEKPKVNSEEEIEHRVRLWRAENERYEQLLLSRIDERRQARMNAYDAFIAGERAKEVMENVPKEKHFYLFNFKGGPGGDLLRTADSLPILDHTVPAGHVCTYCHSDSRMGNGPSEQLPCGCHVHRDCATDQFFLSEFSLIRTQARCRSCGTKFELRQLHTNFEDDAFP